MIVEVKKKFRKIMVITSEAILLLITLFLIYFTVTNIMYRRNPTEVPMPLGFNMFTVLTGSMQPYLETGDKVIVVKSNAEDLKVDDVITFKHDGMIITHRIVEIIENNNPLSFQTKGDYNNAIDNYVITENDIIGKVLFRVTPINYLIQLTR